MLGKNCFRKLISSFTAFAVLCAYSTVALAASKDLTGEITVTGQVTVNGQTAISNATIVSGSTIVTSANSSAVISLGKAGRVEVLADSNLVLNFSDNSIVGILSAGKMRVSNSVGVATTIATRDATVIADSGQSDSFSVEVECSHTHVDTTAGLVTMREGTMDKQIAAGTSAAAGNISQTGCPPCFRPNSAPPVAVGGPLLLLLLAGLIAGGALIIGPIVGLTGNDTNIGGSVIIVSPTR